MSRPSLAEIQRNHPVASAAAEGVFLIAFLNACNNSVPATPDATKIPTIAPKTPDATATMPLPTPLATSTEITTPTGKVLVTIPPTSETPPATSHEFIITDIVNQEALPSNLDTITNDINSIYENPNLKKEYLDNLDLCQLRWITCVDQMFLFLRNDTTHTGYLNTNDPRELKAAEDMYGYIINTWGNQRSNIDRFILGTYK